MNKGKKKKVYNRLIRKLLFQLAVLLAASAVAVSALRELLRGHVADGLVDVISRMLGISWLEGRAIYWRVVLDHMDLIIGGAVLVLFAAVIHFTKTWFTRYFDEMVEGVDLLAAESGEKIRMSPELKFMEEKLNEVREKLENRTEAARQAEQRKNELVAYLAHDIRTPLTSVIGYLSLLKETAELSEKQREQYVRVALDKAYRLEGLIGELFEITRYNLQNIPLHMESVNLCYMMVQITDELYPQLTAANIQVEQQIPEDMTLQGDPEKLARVFNNILKNGATYGRPDSVIKISAREREGRVFISIENEGEIPEDKLEHIFEKFYRLDSARSTSTGGAGLGLAIARDIVALHGGSVKARSGGGKTVFEVELPGFAQKQEHSPQAV